MSVSRAVSFERLMRGQTRIVVVAFRAAAEVRGGIGFVQRRVEPQPFDQIGVRDEEPPESD